MSKFKGRALLLISGPGSESDVLVIRDAANTAMAPFTLEVQDTQNICMGGRIILALDIQCDPAHLSAIETDVRNSVEKFRCDVASEII
mgnify:CR=1 FL=1